MEYLKDPAAIYAKSFSTIRKEVDFSSYPPDVANVAERMIHASGMIDLLDDIAFHDDVVLKASEALNKGAPVLCDCEMVRSGIIAGFLPNSNEVLCLLNEESVPTIANQRKTTRSAAQVSLWQEYLAGAVVVIGNAPTALFALLEALDKGAPKPAAIIATPVGFVGAEESKAALEEDSRGVPFVTVRGRRGGSAIASAAFNAVSKAARDRVAA